MLSYYTPSIILCIIDLIMISAEAPIFKRFNGDKQICLYPGKNPTQDPNKILLRS